MFGGAGLRIARIGGFDVRLDLTWFVMAFLLAAPVWSATSSDPTRALWLSALTVALFFGSVFLHEMAHAVTFRAQGIHVLNVTLWLMGGFTQPASEPKTPRAAFLVSAAGPVASALVGLALLSASTALGDGLPHEIIRYWGRLNLWLAALNALPGFPLDGGHVLRSIVWRATGRPGTATLVAARVGQVVGALLIAAIALPDASFGLFSPAGMAIIGFFMITVATATARDVGRLERLKTVRARDVMSPPPPSIPGDLVASEAIRTYLQGHDGEAFPVVADGRVIGLVSLSSAAVLTPDRPIAEASVASDQIVQVSPDDAMDMVIERLRSAGAPAALVLAGSELVGVIEPADLARLAQRRTAR